MSSSLRADAIGYLGSDCESRALQDGTTVVSFNIATNPYVKQGDEPRTIWVQASMFGQRGEKVAQYLKKGTQVHVRGELNTREWTAKDGTVRFSLELRVAELDLLGSRDNAPAQGPTTHRGRPIAEAMEEIDETPF